MTLPFILRDPQGPAGEGGGSTPAPIIYEHEGKQYNITELLGVKSEYEKHKDDLADLDNLRQDRDALRTLEAGINRDADLVKRVRENVGYHIAGVPVNPAQPITPPATPAQPAAPASGEKPKTPFTPEQMAEIQSIRQQMGIVESQVGSVINVEGTRRFEADKSGFLQKHPEFKEMFTGSANEPAPFYKAGRALIQERANDLIQSGQNPNDAWNRASFEISQLNHEDLMYKSPVLRKVYEDSLIQRVQGGTNYPAGLGTPAETLQTGQPGMTPEADAELVKSLDAAKGDKEKREAAMLQWSRRTGRDPLELYGFAPNDARGLSVPARR